VRLAAVGFAGTDATQPHATKTSFGYGKHAYVTAATHA